ncbi:hypothetical protein GWI33_012370 [Rhynchophorus ferrugineus]|uniref:Uncharacterized protein n=1 Tax=Rhynchophorus ferrugineus TaxID=354439 RepID=A0A834I5K0_RHYFE|nr:hypothetical protein GWI33_012370 [Rhynchophorus ferrugineus]
MLKSFGDLELNGGGRWCYSCSIFVCTNSSAVAKRAPVPRHLAERLSWRPRSALRKPFRYVAGSLARRHATPAKLFCLNGVLCSYHLISSAGGCVAPSDDFKRSKNNKKATGIGDAPHKKAL